MADNTCGKKHFAWACWVFLPLAGLLVTAVLGMVGYVAGKADTGELREVRNQAQKMETDAGRMDERLKRIEDDVRWVRTRLEDGKP